MAVHQVEELKRKDVDGCRYVVRVEHQRRTHAAAAPGAADRAIWKRSFVASEFSELSRYRSMIVLPSSDLLVTSSHDPKAATLAFSS